MRPTCARWPGPASCFQLLTLGPRPCGARFPAGPSQVDSWPGGGPSPSSHRSPGPRRTRPRGRARSPQPGPWLSEARPRVRSCLRRLSCPVNARHPPPRPPPARALPELPPPPHMHAHKDLCMPRAVCLSISSMRSKVPLPRSQVPAPESTR